MRAARMCLFAAGLLPPRAFSIWPVVGGPWPLVSQIGLDPVREPAGSGPDRFPTDAAFAEQAGAARAVVDSDSGNFVVAVPYQPWARDGRWFADVALPTMAASTFWPFAQLAVAH